MPALLLSEPIKSNRTMNVVQLFTLLVHILFTARLLFYKYQKKKSPGPATPTIQQLIKKKFNKEVIFRYVFFSFNRF